MPGLPNDALLHCFFSKGCLHPSAQHVGAKLVAHRHQGGTGLAVGKICLLSFPGCSLNRAVEAGYSLGRKAGDGPSCLEKACIPASTAHGVPDKASSAWQHDNTTDCRAPCASSTQDIHFCQLVF